MSDTMSDFNFSGLDAGMDDLPTFGGAPLPNVGTGLTFGGAPLELSGVPDFTPGAGVPLSLDSGGQPSFEVPVTPLTFSTQVETPAPAYDLALPTPIESTISPMAGNSPPSMGFLSVGDLPVISPLEDDTATLTQGPNVPLMDFGLNSGMQNTAFFNDPNTGGSTSSSLGDPVYSSAPQTTPEQQVAAAKTATSLGVDAVRAGIGALTDNPAQVESSLLNMGKTGVSGGPNLLNVTGDLLNLHGFGWANPQGSTDATVMGQGMQNAIDNPIVPGTINGIDVPPPSYMDMIGGTN